jgi:heterodisulfide reductase subunit A2
MSKDGQAAVGVYICHCGTNIAGTVDVARLVKELAGEPGVAVAREYKFMCSDPGQELLKKDIAEFGLNRVVVAACSPRMHEPTFRRACAQAGLNPFLMLMANIREQCSWVTKDREQATDKAMAIVRASVRRASWLRPLQAGHAKVKPSTLIIGGGIAGIQAALDIAEAGYKVHLVERQQSIGGHMAELDKTFPTLDCSACILTPKMVQVAQHPNIELLTYHEVEEVGGSVGSFKVKIRRKASCVDNSKCTGCGICMTKCPVKKIPSEFDEKMGFRTAIYTTFAQAVPNKPVIDRKHCNYFLRGKCGVCEKFCEPGAINMADQDSVRELEVGTIIVATGYDAMDPAKLGPWGYGRFPDVYTGLEFERLNNAMGPTGGKIVKKNGQAPASVGILHCIGSRDENYCKHCSRVCCMYSLKFAHLLREKTTARVFEFYIDMRAFGKGYEEFYHRVGHEGVRFVRGKAGQVLAPGPSDEAPEGSMIVVAEETTLGKLLRVPVDMIVLATAMEPAQGVQQVSEMLRIPRSPDGFFAEKHPKLAPTETPTDGVFLAGTCQGPKDIPDTVAQASGAAAAAMRFMAKGEVEIDPSIAFVRQEMCTACGMCVEVCAYQAIEIDPKRKKAVVNTTTCKGCGTCVATCRATAIELQHFTDRQIFNEIAGLLEETW